MSPEDPNPNDYCNTFWTDRNRFYDEQSELWRKQEEAQRARNEQANSSNGGGSSGGSGGGECFVATACFQDAQHPTVEDLRTFRDTVLVRSTLGRAFIACYNEVGPHMAKIVHQHPCVRPSLQKMLTGLARRLLPARNRKDHC